MTVDEYLTKFVNKMRQGKEKVVEEFPDDPDGANVIEVHRDGDLVATFMCMPNKNLMLFLIKFAIIGLEADRVAYSMECVTTKHLVNPGTGKPWSGNERQEVYENRPDYWFDGLVEEAIVSQVWDKTGEMALSELKFAVEDGKLIWKDEIVTSSDGDEQIGGMIGENISMFWHDETLNEQAQKAANGERPDLPEMSERLREELSKMSEAERQVRQDIAVLLFVHMQVTQLGHMVGLALCAEPGSERAKLIAEHAPKGLIQKN